LIYGVLLTVVHKIVDEGYIFENLLYITVG